MKSQRIEPGPGQESVWDYPWPPRLERMPERIRVLFAGEVLADTRAAWRVLETSHPPTCYVPASDIAAGTLLPAAGGPTCEWKGPALHPGVLIGGRRGLRVRWSYPRPLDAFEPIADHVAFYAGAMDACFVGDERAEPQPGGFYGGWMTSRIVGPVKGGPGSSGW